MMDEARRGWTSGRVGAGRGLRQGWLGTAMRLQVNLRLADVCGELSYFSAVGLRGCERSGMRVALGVVTGERGREEKDNAETQRARSCAEKTCPYCLELEGTGRGEL
jgi:hypothetical protein